MSIKSFPDYKYLLQENYVEYKHIFLPLLKLATEILCYVFIVMLQLHVCIPCSFLVTNVCNQGKTLCSPCTSDRTKTFIESLFMVYNGDRGK